MGTTMLEPTTDDIVAHIAWVGGRPILLEHDLARIYGITTTRLRGLVQRHPTCFPGEFCFTPEWEELCREGHVVGRDCAAFTFPGALVVAALLKRRPAVMARSIQVARAFEDFRHAVPYLRIS